MQKVSDFREPKAGQKSTSTEVTRWGNGGFVIINHFVLNDKLDFISPSIQKYLHKTNPQPLLSVLSIPAQNSICKWYLGFYGCL